MLRRSGFVLMILGVAACAGSAPTATRESPASPSAAPSETADASATPASPATSATSAAPAGSPTSGEAAVEWLPPGGPLASGTYVTGTFQPRLKLTAGEGWATELEFPDIVVLRHVPSGGTLNIAKLDAGLDPDDPAGRKPVDIGTSVDDAVEWVREHPYLDVTDAGTMEIGGVEGVALDVRIDPTAEIAERPDCPGDKCLLLLRVSPQRTPADRIALFETARDRLIFLEVAGQRLVVNPFTDEANAFDAFIGEANELLATIEFDPAQLPQGAPPQDGEGPPGPGGPGEGPAPVDPGTYTSTTLGVAIRYEVGEGWTAGEDIPDVGFFLARADRPAAITVTQFTGRVFADPCTGLATENPKIEQVDNDPRALVRHLDTIEQLDVSEPQPVTVGGFEGVQVDVTVELGPDCQGDAPWVWLWELPEVGDFHLAEDVHARVIAVEVEGTTVAIVIEAVGDADYEAFLEQAMEVVESIRIEP